MVVNPHQRCGYNTLPFAKKDTFLFCRAARRVGGWASCGSDTKSKLYLRKRCFFVIEEDAEDVKHDEKHVLDLLESILRPTCLVKEELRRILFQISQFRTQNHKHPEVHS